MKKVHIAITIDTECDKGAKWKVKQPLSFKNTREGIVNNLQPIFDKYNVKATYLLSPEVMIDDKSIAVFKGFGDKVELGTHLHAEFIEPKANFKCTNTSHFQCDFNYLVEKAKMESLTELFVKVFGYRPTSFRAGRFGISKDSLQILNDLGYTVDSSVTPDIQWTNQISNKKVNFFGAPYQPYHPSKEDFRKKGTMNILQVPVTLMNKKISKWPYWLKRKIILNKSYQHIIFNYLTNFSKPKWLRPTHSDLDTMKSITNDFIKMKPDEDVFLCMMFHSNEFEIDTSPFSLTHSNLELLTQRLDLYLYWLFNNHNASGIGLSEIKNHIKKVRF